MDLKIYRKSIENLQANLWILFFLIPISGVVEANNGNNIRLLTPKSDLEEEKKLSTYMLTLLPKGV